MLSEEKKAEIRNMLFCGTGTPEDEYIGCVLTQEMLDSAEEDFGGIWYKEHAKYVGETI